MEIKIKEKSASKFSNKNDVKQDDTPVDPVNEHEIKLEETSTNEIVYFSGNEKKEYDPVIDFVEITEYQFTKKKEEIMYIKHDDILKLEEIEGDDPAMRFINGQNKNEISIANLLINPLEGEDTIDGSSYPFQSFPMETCQEKSSDWLFIRECCNCKSTFKAGFKRDMAVNAEEKQFTCNLCNCRPTYKLALKTHSTIHPISGNPCNAFACYYCNFRTSNNSNLESHMKMHLKSVAYSCSHCDYRSSRKTNLWNHIRKHSRVKPFSCARCGFMSNDKSGIRKHNQIHLNVKPLACIYCGYKSWSESDLNIHMRSHAKVKPYIILLNNVQNS